YADQLEKEGYVVLPNNVFTDPRHKKALLDEASNFPEFKKGTTKFVMGGFAALGNPSSFHNPTVRKFRQWAVSLVVGGVLKHLIALTGKPYGVEQFIGRMMIRLRGETPSSESWHRDESTIAFADDRFFGGWINLDDTSQHFSCVPRTHMTTTTSHKGFAKISQEEARKHKKNKERVEIPSGHILVFYENIVHEVLSTKATSTLARLHLGWRLTTSSGMRPDVLPTIENQGIAKIKSGQMPPMHVVLHWTNWADALQKWSVASLQKQCLIQRDFKTGGRKGEKLKVVERFMRSLREYKLPMYEKYTADELKLYQPSTSWRVLKPGSDSAYVRVKLDG
ncbi:unnamed protein product, partial [Ectocarpus sp. 12 AP-2014]